MSERPAEPEASSPTVGDTLTDGSVVYVFLGYTPYYALTDKVDDLAFHYIPQQIIIKADSQQTTNNIFPAAKIMRHETRSSVTTTTNAADQLLTFIAMPANSSIHVRAVVNCKRSGVHASSYVLEADFYKDGNGAPTLIGSVTKTSNKVGNAVGQDVTLVGQASGGGSIRIGVTPGETATWVWGVYAEFTITTEADNII